MSTWEHILRKSECFHSPLLSPHVWDVLCPLHRTLLLETWSLRGTHLRCSLSSKMFQVWCCIWEHKLSKVCRTFFHSISKEKLKRQKKYSGQVTIVIWSRIFRNHLKNLVALSYWSIVLVISPAPAPHQDLCNWIASSSVYCLPVSVYCCRNGAIKTMPLTCFGWHLSSFLELSVCSQFVYTYHPSFPNSESYLHLFLIDVWIISLFMPEK